MALHLKRYFYPKAPDDIIFFYNFREFNDFVLSQGKVTVPLETLERRRAEFALHFSQTPPPELIWYHPETKHWRPAVGDADEGIEEAPDRYQGIPASAGSGPVEGVAVVTNDPIEAGRRLLELEGDVILVTRLTDPAWSSLFARLSGVITELGGVISHASIVARENGLPAVVGIPEVTKWVRNGQRLRIDGATGIVEVLE
jgi:pyruvate,water dikinase